MITHTGLDVLNLIKEGVYLGNSAAAANSALLKTHHITHILICCSEIAPSFPETFEYKKLNIQETFDFNISEYFAEAYEFIEEAVKNDGTVLAHCGHGQSRSPTLVISYLMKRYRMSCKTALKFVRKKHPLTEPNVGFVEQLGQYERFLAEHNPTAITCGACNCLIQ